MTFVRIVQKTFYMDETKENPFTDSHFDNSKSNMVVSMTILVLV